MAKEEKNFKELTSVIRLSTFLEAYAPNINPTGGIYHRINGKSTSKTGKPRELTIEDKQQLSLALKSLSYDINQVAKGFDKDVKNG